MNNSLLPWTRMVLAVSALVQILVGAGAFVVAYWNFRDHGQVWVLLQYFGALSLTNGLGAAYALHQNNWAAAHTYLIVAGPLVALDVVVTFLNGVVGQPTGFSWYELLAVILAVIYLPVVIWVWTRESKPAHPV